MSVFPHAARRGGLAATVLAALAIAVTSIPALAQNSKSQSPAKAAPATVTRTPDWDHFSADITLKRTHVDGSGKPKGEFSPDVTYHWERTKNGTGWRTSITLVRRSKPVAQTANGKKEIDVPIAVTRMEDDEDGKPVRFYGADGKELHVPTTSELDRLIPGVSVSRPDPAATAPLQAAPTPRPGVAGRDWAESILVGSSTREDRRRALERQFGRSTQQIGQLDRYVGIAGGARREVLVDRDAAVPVEINVSLDAALVSHTAFEYERQGDGSLLRRRTRTEQRLSADSEDRLVSEIDLTNVRFDRKVGPR